MTESIIKGAEAQQNRVGAWYFSRLQPSGTLLAVAPSGEQYVVKGGNPHSPEFGRLFDAMVAALAVELSPDHPAVAPFIAAEREACADVADYWMGFDKTASEACEEIAQGIRERAELPDVSRQLAHHARAHLKCDGNHGGPRCADPGCWNDSPAQPQPVAIPAELRFSVRHRIVEDAGYKGPTAEHNAIIQGVLDHLRAPAQPATTERAASICDGFAAPDMAAVLRRTPATTEPEWETSPMDGEQWETTPMSATTEPGELTRSQKLRNAGYTRRPSWKTLPSDADDADDAPETNCGNTTERKGEPTYTWEAVDGKQHDTGRVTQGPRRSFFATTASPEDARLIAEALNNTSPQVPEGFALLLECAQRLVEHADFKLAGVLSSESEVREIPSKAGSWVKARHLAALRDSVRALRDAAQAKEGGE